MAEKEVKMEQDFSEVVNVAIPQNQKVAREVC